MRILYFFPLLVLLCGAPLMLLASTCDDSRLQPVLAYAKSNVTPTYAADAARAYFCDSDITDHPAELNLVAKRWPEALQQMAAAGIEKRDRVALFLIGFQESRWDYKNWNDAGLPPYGICQTDTKVHKKTMRKAGPDFMNNPVTQVRWCNNYAQRRYGNYAEALAFRNRNALQW